MRNEPVLVIAASLPDSLKCSHNGLCGMCRLAPRRAAFWPGFLDDTLAMRRD